MKNNNVKKDIKDIVHKRTTNGNVLKLNIIRKRGFI